MSTMTRVGRSGAANSAYTHGGTGTRLYQCWWNMRQRCVDPNKPSHYGLLICEEWADFAEFKKWALSAGYTDQLTLDRIDNTIGYVPSNCRWATRKEQARNYSKNIRIEAFGEEKTLIEWAEDSRCFVSYATLWARVRRHGYPLEAAMQATSVRDLRATRGWASSTHAES